jgi:hypothetical protein
MAAYEEPWQLLLSGTLVRIVGAARQELEGATGVLGTRSRNDPSRAGPARHLVRLVSPPEAVAAFPRGVFVPLEKLAAAGGAPPPGGAAADGGDSDAPNDDDDVTAAAAARAAARTADEAARIALASALGMRGMREVCNHGACYSTTALQADHRALMSAVTDSAPPGDGASMLRAARKWLAEHPGAASEALRRRCLAMAVDAELGDGPPFPPFMVAQICTGAAAAALALRDVAAGAAAPDDTALAAESLSSPLRVRRTLAAEALCHCLRVCAARGCGARRARTEAGATAAAPPPLMLCSACRAVYYCCAEHQQEHWHEHKRECKALAASAASAAAARPQPRTDA